jgi:hypothetical protein
MKTSIYVLRNLAIIVLLGLAACKKENSNSNSRKVEYKVIVSPQTTITEITYTDENGLDKKVTPDKQSIWSSGTLTIPASVNTLNISAVAPGSFGLPLLSMKVQIYVDGVLKKEETKDGPNQKGYLTAKASY